MASVARVAMPQVAALPAATCSSLAMAFFSVGGCVGSATAPARRMP
ncbi:hypothetical protein WJ968_05655 [Achromobacter xylosoxidans]